MSNNLTYATISIDDFAKIDFSQIGEDSGDTVRYSIDLMQFVIKWNAEPTFIEDEEVIPIGIYSYNNILTLMATDEWSEPLPDE